MTVLDRIARGFGRLGAAATLAGRTLLSVDTNPVPGDWEHVTKVDPEDAKKLPLAYPRYLSRTDGVSVGGSADVTETNTVETFRLLSAVPTPAFHEPSAATHVTRETLSASTFLAIPQVLNGDDEAFVGTLGTGTRFIREEMIPAAIEGVLPGSVVDRYGDRLCEFLTRWTLFSSPFEAYIIQNPDSAAAREAGVDRSGVLSPKQARERAMAADRYLGSEIVYVEYSGTYGGTEAIDLLAAVDSGLSWSRLWYGGGIDSREKATAVLDAGADTVVVGDAFHRIATEEVELATDFLSDSEVGASAHADRIARWLDAAVDVESSAAAEFLSTIPSVRNPVEAARESLTAGIAAHCTLASAAADVREAVTEGRIASPAEIPQAYRIDYADRLATHLRPSGARGGGAASALPNEVLEAVSTRVFDEAFDGQSGEALGPDSFPLHHVPVTDLPE